ncbi:sortase (surface protein transpeptidase) [Agrococcus sp. UYP10]|uniref:class F sortase n=1 Tax=Agrococcus sp. UYP10 TaxID=1756355 RepID=UPI00339A68D9
MIEHNKGRRLRLTAGAAALVVALTALTACSSGSGQEPPTAAPEASTAPAAEAPAAETPTPSAAPASEPLVLEASAPVSVQIPSIGLDASLIHTGIREDGALEVPPGEEGSPGSWWDGSPTPGERGASVLLGQVNSTTDDSGVFYDLPRLVEGDEVRVTREDGSVAVFEVYSMETFAKDSFPTRAVYYPVADAELRLITCHKGEDSSSPYPNNYVVFARLVGSA